MNFDLFGYALGKRGHVGLVHRLTVLVISLGMHSGRESSGDEVGV